MDDIIETQSQEYFHAIEHHMLIAQKELQALRRKAASIANDKTKDQKLHQLDMERQRFVYRTPSDFCLLTRCLSVGVGMKHCGSMPLREGCEKSS